MSLQSDLGRVKGLGSSKSGTSHWWAQRVTALALIPLTLWFIYSTIKFVGMDLISFGAWLNEPGSVLLLSLFLIALFYHMQLGLQVVIEDYVHGEKNKVFLLLINKFAAALFAISSLVAIIQIAYGG
ncbi:MAG: succinate dehydrogenase, hydrophobic membrane anchor protein [Rhodospirillaceae bacterium]|nr:succinate dehydrogenase, hydrophobic membrane anchor protein [Rhodospirillaceae bacterium]OUT76192.1 MAG: succinate dehydrogenase, hydrophobic membrane anchor protein [Rhodospirillaceae bacterium TMED23]|tara:strand:+ start:6798 stop:7178 length:381 start_codon:yes stop_codon:yes gene_type:complete